MKQKNCMMLLLVFISFPIAAHVRWFVESSTAVRYQFSSDSLSWLIILGGVVFCLACYLFETNRKRNDVQYLGRFPWFLLPIAFGIMFLTNIKYRVFVAPNVLTPQTVEYYCIVTQSLIAVACLNFFSLQIAGAGLIALTFFLLAMFPFGIVMDYAVEFIGAGLALLFIGGKYSAVDKALALVTANEGMALAFLRIGLGLQLMVLAIHNKLMNPGLVMEFLTTHHYNFMSAVGLSAFSDIHFVLSVGVAELCFGLMLVLGLAVRFVTSIVAFFFMLTSTLLGLEELVGHLPIMALALILLCKGGGDVLHFRLTSRLLFFHLQTCYRLVNRWLFRSPL